MTKSLGIRSRRTKSQLAADAAAGVRPCYGCKKTLQVAAFYNSAKLTDCKNCHKQKQWKNFLVRTYSITQQEYYKILEEQGGGCAICGRPPKKNRLSVDHDHKTGLVRGLTCHTCNYAVGALRDSPEIVMAAFNFLTSPPAISILGEARYGIKGRVTNKASTKRRLNPERYSS